MTEYGIDLSKYQKGIDWSAIKAAGVSFAVARASIGFQTDATFASHRDGALNAQLVAGAYHFLEPGDGALQADLFVSATNRCHDLLAALDCEAPGLSIGLIRQFASRFATLTNDHPLFIYTGIAYWRHLGNPKAAALGPLWLAFYPGGGYPGDASPIWSTKLGDWPAPTIWQYGPRPIKGRASVDGDAYRGTRAELEAFTAAVTSGPQQPAGGDVISKVDAGTLITKGRAPTFLTGIYPEPDGTPIASTLKAGITLPMLGGVEGWRKAVVVLGGVASEVWLRADEVTGTPDPALQAAVVAGKVPLADCAVQDARIAVLEGTVSDREDRLRRIQPLAAI